MSFKFLPPTSNIFTEFWILTSDSSTRWSSRLESRSHSSKRFTLFFLCNGLRTTDSFPIGELMVIGGTYCLIIKLEKSSTIQVGKLGSGFFPKGYYVYVGSALNGLEQRLTRHLSQLKKKHWHVDYLLEYAKIIGTRKIHSVKRGECLLSEEVGSICHRIPMEGFGSSDCRCLTHLYFFSHNPLSDPRFKMI